MERNRAPIKDAVLWRRLADGDERAREELISLYLPYAKRLARRFRAAPEPTDDLVQVASIGLVKAVDRFEPDRGIPFQGFATPTIIGELKRHFRDRVWTVRVPRSLHDRLAEVDQASTDLRHELRRSPSVRELAKRTALPETEVLEALEANQNRRVVSLDQPLGFDETDGETLIDRIESGDESYEAAEERISVAGELPKLSEREQTVLRLRFVEEMTQSQIAERIGVSQMQVSRILARTLKDLRERIESPRGRNPP